MGGVAALAKAAGHTVTGSDANVYPPMSTQLEELGISLYEGWDPAQLEPEPDCVVIGNALSRGNAAVEAVLDRNLDYCSGPRWLAENLLRHRWVIAVAGTHGKTTTSAMVAWILEHAGLNPGFLIGGVPGNFGVSARYTDSKFFVVEADEYDTAFFDKRSKFVHYRPRTLIFNNLEYDHADIFPDLASIKRQFHHLIRTVPGSGLIVHHGADVNVANTLEMGCWSQRESFAADAGGWQATECNADGSRFTVSFDGEVQGRVEWNLMGDHNVANALAAIAAARHAGVPANIAIEALAEFKSVKRRMELRGEVNGVKVFDDFAHHPTAIRSTIDGLRAHTPEGRVIAVLEPRSNTMRMGVHRHELAAALTDADAVFLYQPANLNWNIATVSDELGGKAQAVTGIEKLVATIAGEARPGDSLLIMSNGGFEGLHDKLLAALQDHRPQQAANGHA